MNILNGIALLWVGILYLSWEDIEFGLNSNSAWWVLWLILLGVFVMIVSASGLDEKPKKKKKKSKNTIPKSNTSSKKTSKSKVIGHKTRFILIYEKGPQQEITEELIGVFGQAQARKVIEAKYKNDTVKRISWINDSGILE